MVETDLARAVGIDAHRVDARLVAGGVGAHRVGGIGDDASRCRRSRPAPCAACRRWRACRSALPSRDALGQDARRGAVRRRHAVADEQDDVLRLARAGVVDRPGDLAAMLAVAARAPRRCRASASATSRRIRGRLVLAVLALDEGRRLAEHCGVVVAVHRHLDLGRVGDGRELDLEVETGAGQDLGAVDRIDRLGRAPPPAISRNPAASNRRMTACAYSTRSIERHYDSLLRSEDRRY